MSNISYRFVLSAVVVMAAVSGGYCAAQDTPKGATAENSGLTVRELRPKPTPAPIPLDSNSATIQSLTFLSPEQMSAADRTLVDSHLDDIAARAERQGFNLDSPAGGKTDWGYEQAVCPVFPQHMILEYSRGSDQGEVTLFSVVIPRREGHVRVIPARRKGYSLFTPVASNGLTINDFNHIVQEEGGGLSPDWLTLGLCYSALASGHVRAALHPSSPADEVYPLSIPAILRVSGKGGAEVWFGDTTPSVKRMDWELLFAQNGRLVKVRHVPSQLLREKPVAGQIVDVQGLPAK